MIVQDCGIVEGFKDSMEKLFDTKIDKIIVCILSKEEFQPFKTAEWMVGFAYPRKSAVFVINEKDSGRSHDEWLKVIKHEIVHIFFEHKFHTGTPAWLNEGLASYLSGQKKSLRKIDIKDLIKHHQFNNDGEIYSIGYNSVKKILEDNEHD